MNTLTWILLLLCTIAIFGPIALIVILGVLKAASIADHQLEEFDHHFDYYFPNRGLLASQVQDLDLLQADCKTQHPRPCKAPCSGNRKKHTLARWLQFHHAVR